MQAFSHGSILYQKQSDFQDILVFKSAQYGNVLVLDGVIQLTERDEFAYHEMMVHLPLCSHPNPRNILIVGGGDGGVLREVCKHACVQSITLVEIDPQVIAVAKQYFQGTAAGFRDSRVQVVNADAADFLATTCSTGSFDVILGDTSDPVGPAESLFQPAFYESMYAALTDRGVICVQAECLWIHLDLICDLTVCCLDIGFDSAEYTTTMVPTYPCGQIGFLVASKGRRSCRQPLRNPACLEDLQWYSAEMHLAAFALPPFVLRRLERALQNEDEDVTAETNNGILSRGALYNNDDDEKLDDNEGSTCFLDGLLRFFQALATGNLLEDCVKNASTTEDAPDDYD